MRIPKSNRSLARAIVACFRESPAVALQGLAGFASSEWDRTETWLDTSGLALYFWQHIQSLGIADVVDLSLQRRLEDKFVQNTQRTAEMLDEFAELNNVFKQAGFCYANLKGFTLAPDSCPNPALRHQSDYDFLIAPDDLSAARDLLLQRGYVIAGFTERTLEFKQARRQIISIAGQYQRLCHRSIELHTSLDTTGPSARDPRLNRLALWRHRSDTYPALSSPDQFLCQALHLLGHLRHEYTKVSWLLEYRQHALAHQHDDTFWNDVRTLALESTDGPLALGLVAHIAADLFGDFLSPSVSSWTHTFLPHGAALWAQKFGRQAVMADIPGTKLYLFLEGTLDDPTHTKATTLQRLVPLRLPQRVVNGAANGPSRKKLRLSVLWFRLRFHLKQNALYLFRLPVWKFHVHKSKGIDHGTSVSRHCINSTSHSNRGSETAETR
jgi:hypothetical protein